MSEQAVALPEPIQAPPQPEVEGSDSLSTDEPLESGFLDSIEDAFSSLEQAPVDIPLHGAAKEGGVEKTVQEEKEKEPESAENEAEVRTEEKNAEPDEISELLDFEPPEGEKSGWTPSAAKSFRKSKEVIKGLQEELAEVKSRLGESSTRVNELESTGDNPDLNSMRSQLKEYQQRDMITNVEQSDAFKELVTNPMTELVAQSDAIAERNGVDPEELLDAIAMDDVKARKEALTELMVNADDEDRYKVYSIIERMEPLFERRAHIFNNIEEAAKELEDIENQKAKQAAAQALESRTKAANAVGERIRDRMTFLDEMEGVDLESMINEAAGEDPGSLDPVKGTFNSISGKLIPKLAREIFKLNKERDELLAQLSGYESAEPSAGGGASIAGGAQGANSDDSGFMDAIARALG